MARLRQRFAILCAWWDRWLPRPSDIRSDPDYQVAHDFKDSYEPSDGVDYKWVSTYARETYDRFEQANQNLDAKAESIIKLLGGGTGLVTLGAIVRSADVAKLNMASLLLLAISLGGSACIHLGSGACACSKSIFFASINSVGTRICRLLQRESRGYLLSPMALSMRRDAIGAKD